MMPAPLAYSGTQKALHWLVAGMVFILIPVGFYMVWRGEVTDFDATTNQLYTAHKTFGFVLLWLVILRIAVRWKTGVPAPVSTLSRIQVIVSEAVHKLLYGLLIVTPLLGWLGVSAYGARGAFFGLSLPEILPKNDALATQLLTLHGYAALAMLILVAAHIGAALMHLVIFKDGVFRRMMG